MLKNKNIYSYLELLPKGKAKDNYITACLVLEGGAFRGLYSAGALDCLMLNDINLSHTVGVSAGALMGLNYVSGDIGRSARINLTYRHDSRYVGKKAIRRNNEIIGFDFLFSEEVEKLYPFDLKRFSDPGLSFTAVASDCWSGEATYFEKNDANIFLACKASSAMPYLSKMVMINGRPYLDGGATFKIPIDYALNHNYKKIIVVNTRDRNYRRKDEDFKQLNKLIYHNYPNFQKALANTNSLYNECQIKLNKLEKEKRIFRLAPLKPITINRLEGDMEKLGELYWQGYYETLNLIDEIKEYLFEEIDD